MSLSTLITVSVLPEKKIPTAVAKADPDFGIIGSVVRIDGRLSTDPDNTPLTYTWTFDSVPIGSQVQAEGFRLIDEDGAVVSFSPDIVGEYVIGLTVSNGMFSSDKAQTFTTIRAILVPHGKGLVPDGKWIWKYIRDVWDEVENKELFETLWSALIQIIGGELLKLYQVDFNKSIRDIQDLYQRRWLSYEPELEILVNGPDYFFGNHYAGTDASTINLGLSGSLIILNPTEVVLIEGSALQGVQGETLTISSSRNPANNGEYKVLGLNSAKNGYKLSPLDPVPDTNADLVAIDIEFSFGFQSVNWVVNTGEDVDLATLLSESGSLLDTFLPITGGGAGGVPIQVGDVIIYKAGLNKGIYRVRAVSGTFVTVDHPPPSFSDATTSITYKTDIYRPVHFEISQPDVLLTDTIAIPFDPDRDISQLATGRLIVLNGQAYTVVRSSIDNNQRQPTVIITVDQTLLQSGLQGLTWRTPPTLISTTQDFGVDGVSTGDLIKFNIVQDGKDVSGVSCQVVGVDRGRLGFVFSTEPLSAGVVPPVPPETILQLASDFGIDGVSKNPDGSLSYSGTAARYLQEIQSGLFKDKYWNTELTPDSNISINPNFQVKPRTIVRNTNIPVDETLVSIPLLQNYIVQPTINERDGKFFQVVDSQEFEVKGPSRQLRENIDYTIGGELAFDGSMAFQTGTDVVSFDDGDFIDRGIGPGDQFVIIEPITLARTYYVQAVVSASKLKLTRPIPEYPNSPIVTAKVQIRRSRQGNFIRFTPGQFSAKKPAPSRFWAEVSMFDNNENVENNFGILVGVSRADIEAVSADLNYRQAVSGILFAFLRGSSIEKIRLGAQILLGLPFAENRGIIRSIEDDYRLDIHGVPILGRLLIEDVDNTGAALGTLRPYTFPIDPISDLAGLEINPTTKALYKVGDIVEKFAALSKGVEITDYITNPTDLVNTSTSRILQQYHAMKLRVNDNLFTLQEIGLVSSFLKKITPSYIAFFISSLSEFADEVTVTDAAFGRIRVGDGALVDNASLCIPPAIHYTSRNGSGIPQISIDEGPHWVRRSGRDLQTTVASSTVSITAGGVLNPRAHEQFEAPLTVVGDRLVIFGGQSAGTYSISVIHDDLSFDVAGLPFGFGSESNLRYAIVRPIRQFFAPLAPDKDSEPLVASLSGVITGATVKFSGGLRSLGVAPGDIFHDPNGPSAPRRRVITDVSESVPGSDVWDTITVTPAYVGSRTDLFALSRGKIVKSPYPQPWGVTIDATGQLYSVTTPVSAFALLPSLTEIGDEIVELDGSGSPINSYMVLASEQKYISAATPNAVLAGASLVKKNRPFTGPATSIAWNVIQTFDPVDVVDAGLTESQNLASCTAGSKVVTLQMQRTTAPAGGVLAVDPTVLHVKPGDFLRFNSGAASAIELGYGSGLYPIVAISTVDVTVVQSLPSTESVSWTILRRR